MLDKLEAIKERFEEVGQLIIQPDAMSDMSKYTKLSKEYKDLEKVVAVYNEFRLVLDNIRSSKEILEKEKDPDFREMAKAELDELRDREVELEKNLKQMLIPKDPNDSKDCILEIRGGAGGDEAAIFAGDLFRMYSRYAETKGWQIEIINDNYVEHGGYK
jgi:peptide chain release factor 1